MEFPSEVIEQARAEAACAAGRAGVIVREVHDPAECARLVEVLNDVWGTDVDIIDHAFLTALAHAGCYVAAAFRPRVDGLRVDGTAASRPEAAGTGATPDPAEMVGAGVAFFGAEPGVVHSHVLGARPGHAARGVGQAVKAHSRLWCLEHGVRQMTWTYDPLQARNTYLNLHVFGARLADYVEDFYGELNDGLNTGFPTDRAVLTWDVAAPREPLPRIPADLPVALPRAGAAPGAFTTPSGPLCRTAIPQDVDALRRDDPETARAWAAAVQAAFQQLRAAGWTPRDATRDAHIIWERTS